MIKTQVEKIREKFDAGQQIYRRVSIEILLARIQQLEIQAAQLRVQLTGGVLPASEPLSPPSTGTGIEYLKNSPTSN